MPCLCNRFIALSSAALIIKNVMSCRYYSTIFAVSSGQGKCGVAVVRVSGSKAYKVLKLLAGFRDVPPARQAILRRLRHPYSGDTIDRGLVLWFPQPRSFTGEDTCELHIHGGKAVVAAVMGALGNIPGLQPAEPGEFTRRAFLGGKLDLTEVEGLADLLQAETEAQRKQALLQMEGHLGTLYSEWRKSIIQCMAHVEAFIDFSEDDNIEDGVLDSAKQQVTQLLKELQNHLADERRGEILRNGVQASIVGKPNVGKSSLLNALAQRPAAIVTPNAGTTRDVVQLSLDLGGFPVQLADTAGLRASTDDAEQQGIARARVLAQEADLVLLVAEASEAMSQGVAGLPAFLDNYVMECQISGPWKNYLVVLNKCDLIDTSNLKDELPENVVISSCKTEEGFNSLLFLLQGHLAKLCGEPSRECPSLTQARHRLHLLNCVQRLNKFLVSVNCESDLVLAAENLRQAVRHLGLITGHVTSEQLLDVIFSDFCIGK